MKFIVGTASYLTFLLLLVLASQVKPDGSGDDPGPPPSTIEWILLPWIISLIFRCVFDFSAYFEMYTLLSVKLDNCGWEELQIM